MYVVPRNHIVRGREVWFPDDRGPVPVFGEKKKFVVELTCRSISEAPGLRGGSGVEVIWGLRVIREADEDA